MSHALRHTKYALLLGAAVAMTSCGHAKQPAMVSSPSGDFVNHTFTIPSGERVRVFLAGQTEYRAEVDGTGIQLQVRAYRSGTQQPMVRQLVPGTSAGSASLYTIRSYADAEYEFRTIGGDPGKTVTLTISKAPAGL